MNMIIKKAVTVANTKLTTQTLRHTSMALALSAFSLGMVACSGGEEEHHEVMAVDMVDEASEQARMVAPEPEVVEFEDTTPATTTDEVDVVDTGIAVVDGETEVEVGDTASQSDDVAIAEETDTSGLSANAGQELYEQTCHVCHEAGLLGAPKIGDTVAWAPRIEKGIDTLHQHSAEGYNQMPPQAVGDVSEEQVYAAVDYIVAQSS